MDLLGILHLSLLCFPLVLLLIYSVIKFKLNRKIALLILFLYYLVPITWSINENECPLTNMEKMDPKKEAIRARFPSAPFLPLHFDTQLSSIFKFLGVKYNDNNMSRVIVGWNVLDFLIILWFCM
jgi:hypothetical protein